MRCHIAAMASFEARVCTVVPAIEFPPNSTESRTVLGSHFLLYDIE